ncbi:MAG TPA: hypothetical protein VNB06_18620 [Thermoanaerobaculia bacterium]|nr:hypothetical protein [Thermoanaerobaculia bacterium]
MLPRADLILYDRDGQLIAVAEVKNKVGTSREWAAQLRRNMLAHGGFRPVGFFLLATPDQLYVWRDAGKETVPFEPTYEIDARPVLQPYFSRAGIDPATVSGEAFELIVAAWLADLTRSPDAAERSTSEESWLTDSGFLGAVRNGRVEYEAAA